MDRLAAAESRLTTLLDRLDHSVTDPAQKPISRAVFLELSRERGKLLEERDRLAVDVKALASALEETRNSNHRLEVRIAELSREVKEIHSAVADADAEVAGDVDMSQRLADAEYVAEEALTELEAAQSEIADLKVRLNTAEAAKAEGQAELFRIQSSNEAADRKLDQSISRLDRFIAE